MGHDRPEDEGVRGGVREAVVGAKHAIAVNSCTAALHLALEASRRPPGDEVITTPYTFAATARSDPLPRRPAGARRRRADTCNIDPSPSSRAITPRTKAIIPVHIAGHAVDLDPILRPRARAWHRRHRGRGARAPGAVQGAHRSARSATSPASASTPPRRITDRRRRDDHHRRRRRAAERCRIMSLHGISRDAWKRYTAEGTWYYEIVAPGLQVQPDRHRRGAGAGAAAPARADVPSGASTIAARYDDAFARPRDVLERRGRARLGCTPGISTCSRLNLDALRDRPRRRSSKSSSAATSARACTSSRCTCTRTTANCTAIEPERLPDAHARVRARGARCRSTRR